MSDPIKPLSDIETASCKTSDQWLRRFLERNPTLHAFAVLDAYRQAGMLERFGILRLGELEQLQAEMGVAGLSPEVLHARQEEGARLRAEKLLEHKAARERKLALTTEQLGALEDRELIDAVWYRTYERVSDRASYEALPTAARLFYANFRVDAAVDEGGFEQCFATLPGKLVEDALACLREIGALPLGGLLAGAMKARGNAESLRAIGRDYNNMSRDMGPDLLLRFVRSNLDP